MAKQFSPQQVDILRQLIDEHQRGLSANTGEHFAPRQKPLTYGELEQLRGILNGAPHAVKTEAPTKTSVLLTDAAQLIHDLMIGRGVDRKNGWRWEVFVADLRERAAAFKAVEDEEGS